MAKKDKYDILTQDITKYLKDKNVYDDIDTIIIQFIADTMELYDMAQDDVRKRGLMIDISKESEDREYLQTNNSVAIRKNCLDTISALFTKLGLTVLDRTKLKLKDSKEPKSPLDEL